MLDALVAGSRNPEVLAELARGRLRSKIPQLQAALTGRFGPNHALVVGEILAHMDYIVAAMAAVRTKGTYLAAQYGRLAGRRGKRRARKAVGHSILIGAWHILHDNIDWAELGGNYFERRQDPERLTRRKLNEIRSLGWTVTANPDGTTTITPAAA